MLGNLSAALFIKYSHSLARTWNKQPCTFLPRRATRGHITLGPSTWGREAGEEGSSHLCVMDPSGHLEKPAVPFSEQVLNLENEMCLITKETSDTEYSY